MAEPYKKLGLEYDLHISSINKKGIKKDQARADFIKWLGSLSD